MNGRIWDLKSLVDEDDSARSDVDSRIMDADIQIEHYVLGSQINEQFVDEGWV